MGIERMSFTDDPETCTAEPPSCERCGNVVAEISCSRNSKRIAVGIRDRCTQLATFEPFFLHNQRSTKYVML